MFEPGDLIVYGSSGVCRVESIGKPQMALKNNDRLYYTLDPLYGTETIFTPVDTKVFMRPVLTKEEAEELIANIPAVSEDYCQSSKPSMLVSHYQACFDTHDCKDLIQLIKTVYSKKRAAEESGKKPGEIDKRFMSKAEELLYGELAISLDIPRDKVVEYIAKSIKKSNRKEI